MTRDDVLKDVNAIFTDVLDNESIILNYATNADDVEEWDSLTNIQLIVTIEKHFKIKFTAVEIKEWKNVGELCDSILKKLNR